VTYEGTNVGKVLGTLFQNDGVGKPVGVGVHDGKTVIVPDVTITSPGDTIYVVSVLI